MVSSTGTTAVLARPDCSPAGADPMGAAGRLRPGGRPATGWRPTPGSLPGRPTLDEPAASAAGPSAPSSGPVGPAGPRTAAGARAMRRRRARLAADRRPPSGVLPSSPARSAVVTADYGDEVDVRIQPVGRWVRLACTLCFAATAVLVAVVLLSSGSTQVVGPVVVQPGDSLWSVAGRADPGADRREVVDRIKELNGLTSDTVVAGVVLQVPVSSR